MHIYPLFPESSVLFLWKNGVWSQRTTKLKEELNCKLYDPFGNKWQTSWSSTGTTSDIFSSTSWIPESKPCQQNQHDHHGLCVWWFTSFGHPMHSFKTLLQQANKFQKVEKSTSSFWYPRSFSWWRSRTRKQPPHMVHQLLRSPTICDRFNYSLQV